MALLNIKADNTIISLIELKVVSIKLKPMDHVQLRSRDAILSLIRSQRLISDSPVFDKRISSILIEMMQDLVPCMTVKTYEEIKTLLKQQKEVA